MWQRLLIFLRKHLSFVVGSAWLGLGYIFRESFKDLVFGSMNAWLLDHVGPVLPEYMSTIGSWLGSLLGSALIIACVYWVARREPSGKEKQKDPGASSRTWGFSADKQPTRFTNGEDVTFYRIKVENVADTTKTGVSGYLVNVEKNGAVQRLKETVQLTFAPGEDADALSKAIPSGIPQYLDLAFLTSTGRFGLGTKGRKQILATANIFDGPAQYKLTIRIASDNAPTETVDVLLHLTGDRATTEIECLAVNT